MNELSMCGINCEKECSTGKALGCRGCHEQKGEIFWGTCPVASCCISKNHENCSNCNSFVCDKLHSFAFDKDHGDNGKRIENLKNALLDQQKLKEN